MLHFFDVVYYIKKTFSSIEDVEQTNQKSVAIENAADLNEQNKLITDLVVGIAGASVKTLRDMTVYIHPGRGNSSYKIVNFAVERAYKAIEDFTIDETKLETYRLFLSYLKKTNGASMNSKNITPEDLGKSELLDDEQLQRFVRTYNALK